jgi:thioredoxin reductase (NADPH)
VTTAFDVVIAGSGIAGLTAALTCARLGRKTLVLTGDLLGGQLLSIAKIDGFPGFPDGVAGYDLCPMAQEQAAAAGAAFSATALTGLVAADRQWRIATADGEDHVARAVILATGAGLKELGVPGEDRLRGKGVSHCASCDAPLLRDRTAVIVGGGDSALQEALTLAEFAAHAIILHRGDALPAQAAYRDRVLAHSRIELRLHTELDEILGETKVTGVRVRDRATGIAASLETSGVFVYIGLQANTAVLQGRVALDPDGRIATDGWMRTGLAGICAAGAVRSGWPGRAVAAAGEGAAAAVAIDRFLKDATWLTG